MPETGSAQDRPDGTELLVLAQEYLLLEILPLLPAERQGDAGMIARAITIAVRERAADRTEPEILARSLADLGFDDVVALAAAIRSGALDDDQAVQEWLTRYVSVRLRIGNPDLLSDFPGSRPRADDGRHG